MSNVEALSHQLTHELDNFLDMNQILRDDIQRNLSQNENDQFWRRNFVRSSWSMIEGLVSALKTFTLKGADLGHVSVDAKTREILEERKFEAQPNGTYTCLDVYPRTMQNIKDALKIAASVLDLSWKPDFGGEGWQSLDRSFDKRNKITHPKRVEDLIVMDNNLRDTKTGLGWFIDAISSFQTELLARYSV